MERFEGNDLMATNAKFAETSSAISYETFTALTRSTQGFALPNRYDVIITTPAAGNPRTVSMRCESIELPGRSLNTSPDTNMYGVQPEIVDGVLFGGAIAMAFQASADLEERVFFESWQEMAWDRETWNVMYYRDYVKDIDIYLLDVKDQRRYGVRLKECFPKEIGAINLTYETASDIIKLPVTMQYKYWETLDIQNKPKKSMVDPLPTSGADKTITTKTITSSTTIYRRIAAKKTPAQSTARSRNDF